MLDFLLTRYNLHRLSFNNRVSHFGWPWFFVLFCFVLFCFVSFVVFTLICAPAWSVLLFIYLYVFLSNFLFPSSVSQGNTACFCFCFRCFPPPPLPHLVSGSLNLYLVFPFCFLFFACFASLSERLFGFFNSQFSSH